MGSLTCEWKWIGNGAVVNFKNVDEDVSPIPNHCLTISVTDDDDFGIWTSTECTNAQLYMCA